MSLPPQPMPTTPSQPSRQVPKAQKPDGYNAALQLKPAQQYTYRAYGEKVPAEDNVYRVAERYSRTSYR